MSIVTVTVATAAHGISGVTRPAGAMGAGTTEGTGSVRGTTGETGSAGGYF